MKQTARILIELFKRGKYLEICQIIKLSDKQTEAFLLLCDVNTKELLYGGAAGGGKSWLGVLWLILNCYAFPETRWFIGRKQIKDLEGSATITINKVCREYGFELPNYNGQKNWFIFSNASQIDYKECRYRPEDPLYERLGSFEYTGGWFEEGGEIPFDAYDTLKTRIGRQHNEKYNLISKVFITCNPKKNWIYKDFYKPDKEDSLPITKKFIKALPTDNPYLSKEYIENLYNIKDKSKKERLLFGNWEYDDDPTNLIESYDAIIDCFSNTHVKTGIKYIICDAARFGSDKAIIIVFDGLISIEKYVFDISKTTDISNKIKELQKKYNVPNRHTLVDSDGVGGGVVDEVGCIGFVNNSSPIKIKDNDNYDNLKSQCAFMLADKINTSELYINMKLSEKEKEDIIEEFEQLREVESDNKRKLVSKNDIKARIGRSPDWLDTFIMRMYFELIIPRKGNRIL